MHALTITVCNILLNIKSIFCPIFTTIFCIWFNAGMMTSTAFSSVVPAPPVSYGRYLPRAGGSPNISPQATIRNATVLGNVTVGPYAHIVHATVRADEGSPFYIGPYANIQDEAVIHGHYTQENGQPVWKNMVQVPGQGWYSVYIGQNSTVAHHAIVHGPAYIGQNAFIGFRSTIYHANIGNNVEIGPHSYIENVTIPDNTAIAPSSIITKPEDILKYQVPHKNKNATIAQINTEMAVAYNPLMFSRLG